jgi:FkbM family methyltransferase
VLNEYRGDAALRQYSLRRSGLLAQVRHPLLDMWALEEIFRFGVYEPPSEVARALRGLGRPLKVVDIGGHVGFFGLFVRSLFPDAEVVSFEPDPGNARLLARCIEANGLQDRWRLIQAAAATSDGTVEFASDYHLSRIVSGADDGIQEMHHRIAGAFRFMRDTPLLRAERRQVESRDVFPHLENVDLVKLDIEGGEWDLLSDPRFEQLTAAAIVMEYHPVYWPGQDAEKEVTRRLERAGLEPGPPERSHDAGMLWAWRAPGSSS